MRAKRRNPDDRAIHREKGNRLEEGKRNKNRELGSSSKRNDQFEKNFARRGKDPTKSRKDGRGVMRSGKTGDKEKEKENNR